MSTTYAAIVRVEVHTPTGLIIKVHRAPVLYPGAGHPAPTPVESHQSKVNLEMLTKTVAPNWRPILKRMRKAECINGAHSVTCVQLDCTRCACVSQCICEKRRHTARGRQVNLTPHSAAKQAWSHQAWTKSGRLTWGRKRRGACWAGGLRPVKQQCVQVHPSLHHTRMSSGSSCQTCNLHKQQ